MHYEIIDFHTHPFTDNATNICSHKEYCNMSAENTVPYLKSLGISKICGSVICRNGGTYMHGWHDYSCKAFDEILDAAAHYGCVVSFHSLDNDQMDEMVRRHPHTVFVAAHPGEYKDYMRHLHRMELSPNYHLDLSGTGLFRHGMLRHGIDTYGAERFLFGSDYPTCNPSMFIGGVALDPLLTESEKTLILSQNARRILKLLNAAESPPQI